MQNIEHYSSIIIPYSKIEFTGEILGEGGFGVVKKAIWQHTPVAVKKLKVAFLTDEAIETLSQEAKHHSILRHPNIVTLYGICLEPLHYCMVMEFMQDGSLYNLLHSRIELPWLRRIDISRQIAIGLGDAVQFKVSK